MTTAIPVAPPSHRLLRMRAAWLRALLLTLLFLPVAGVRRTWDLRSYTGTALALLTGRTCAYGYRHVERFLALLAQAGAAVAFTTALARWTTQLWQTSTDPTTVPAAPYYYIDGHRKPVFTDQRIPRGLIGRTGKIDGCRALVLLHDQHGHPLVATTHRGDQHLTIGLPHIMEHYCAVTRQDEPPQVVVDREGMSGDFLATLTAKGWTVVTLLRTDQYSGIAAFTDVGPFVPLTTDRHGTVTREVAAARFALAIPAQPGTTLPLRVALIRDLRRSVPSPSHPDDGDDDREWVSPREQWLADLAPDQRQWWDPTWVATAAPGAVTEPKLIPIVSTDVDTDAMTLARMYLDRWPKQENIIRDWLLPLGLDVNHGYAKTAVVNSEVAKQRTRLEQRRDRLTQWTASARTRYTQAERRAERRYQERKTHGERAYRALNQQQNDLVDHGTNADDLRHTIRERKREIDAELDCLNQRMWRAERERDAEWRKIEQYCQAQRQVLRALIDLNDREPAMYELDNAKDQIMTVFKVALANLGMWTRDQYFPPVYAHATWARLAPFFQLPGRIRGDATTVQVTLQPFNDRQLRCDLDALCTRVNAAAPRLPDGRVLVLTVAPTRSSDLHVSY